MPALAIHRRTSVSPVGLDIGQTGARAAQLQRTDNKWQLSNAIHWRVRREEDRNRGILAIEDRLRRSIKQKDFIGRRLVVGLSQPDVELHALELPEKGQREVDQQIDKAARWEIERLSRFPEGMAETACWQFPKGRGTRTTAIGVAAATQTINDVWSACRRSGAECQRVDVSACALSRVGVLLRPPQADEVWGVLDLGARQSRLIICVDQLPVAARSIEDGGDRWTQRISEAIRVSLDSAELHKCDHGIHATGRGPGRSGGLRSQPPTSGVMSEPVSYTHLTLPTN